MHFSHKLCPDRPFSHSVRLFLRSAPGFLNNLLLSRKLSNNCLIHRGAQLEG